MSKADWHSFKNYSRTYITADQICDDALSIDEITENLTGAITDSANYSIPQSIPRCGNKRQKPLPY